MVQYELKSLKLIALGGQAEIYAIDETKVLRVLKNPDDEWLLKNEFEIMKALKAAGVSVPHVYEYASADGRPALVVERINGSSMMDVMKRNPLKIFKQVRILADMQRAILATDAAEGLYESRQRAKRIMEKPTLLSEDLKSFIMSVIERLPEGKKLCHGDFHPGNILMQQGKYYIIDWFGATKGDHLGDIAHTYLLFKNTPHIPGVSRMQSAMLRFSAKLLAGKYIKTMHGKLHFSWDEFSRWLVVKAAERICFGMPAERKALVRLIEECAKHESDEKEWYKYI